MLSVVEVEEAVGGPPADWGLTRTRLSDQVNRVNHMWMSE